MRKITSVLFSACLGLTGLLCFPSCDDTESFTTDRGALLAFSTDTIQFDTVISTVGSSTRQMKIYNLNEKGVRIASVRLKKASDTPFRVNVDGTYLEAENGARAFDFEVRGKDSIHVFAEVTMPERKQDAPFSICDTLIFMLESGVEQGVILAATGQDAYIWRGQVIERDTTLQAGRPVVVYDSLSVREGVTLTLNAGVQLYFHEGANLWVHGRLLAEGTAAQPVVLRGDRTDRMFDYLPYDNTPSRWGGVRFFPASMNNKLNHVDIHSASYGITCDSSLVDDVKLTLENSILHNIGGEGLGLYHCKSYVANTQISNTLGNCVSVLGGWTEFVHCTLAQFYPWDAARGDALYLADKWLQMPYPLLHAHFLNCVITGYASDVIIGNLDDEAQTADYFFGNCVLRTVTSDDEKRFVHIVYDADEKDGGQQRNFRRFDTDNYLYDFRLDTTSVARNAGLKDWAERYPSDRDEIDRLADEAPDAGCYEFVVEENL